ncbi:hypothetical protein C2869_10435 [Saccharobesus litoralis]|uniref:Uncharacterized protein n=2 Tax=Saccharobesus litoralis TaxID=2172099 RepID=A0A2S0VRI2_9ALTE|nr:hypothetical protein C2869_10435 [Saccharobesus litoralis]
MSETPANTNSPQQTATTQTTAEQAVNSMPEFIVIWANYGSVNKSVDVTCIVQALVTELLAKGEPVKFKVSNDHMGCNPDKAVNKSFAIQFNYQGQNYSLAAMEGEEVDLSLVAPTINVLGAVYGCSKGCFDVTAKVSALLDSVGPTRIFADNATFGDPCKGVKKSFSVRYAIGETIYTRTCKEDESVELAAS